jgi:hypothetical protein
MPWPRPGVVNHGMSGRFFMLLSANVSVTSCKAVGGD